MFTDQQQLQLQQQQMLRMLQQFSSESQGQSQTQQRQQQPSPPAAPMMDIQQMMAAVKAVTTVSENMQEMLRWQLQLQLQQPQQQVPMLSHATRTSPLSDQWNTNSTSRPSFSPGSFREALLPSPTSLPALSPNIGMPDMLLSTLAHSNSNNGSNSNNSNIPLDPSYFAAAAAAAAAAGHGGQHSTLMGANNSDIFSMLDSHGHMNMNNILNSFGASATAGAGSGSNVNVEDEMSLLADHILDTSMYNTNSNNHIHRNAFAHQIQHQQQSLSSQNNSTTISSSNNGLLSPSLSFGSSLDAQMKVESVFSSPDPTLDTFTASSPSLLYDSNSSSISPQLATTDIMDESLSLPVSPALISSPLTEEITFASTASKRKADDANAQEEEDNITAVAADEEEAEELSSRKKKKPSTATKKSTASTLTQIGRLLGLEYIYRKCHFF
jgi:hypothetical protein